MRRYDYYLRETAAGIRRNGVAAFAAMSTAFIALFLFGLALLILREFNVAIEALTGNVQVAVYLNDPVNPDTLANLEDKLRALPAIASVDYWDKTVTCQHFQEIFAGNPAFTEGVNCQEVIPTSIRARLADTSQFAQISAAMGCAPDVSLGKIVCSEPGVKAVTDFSSLLDTLTILTRVLSISVLVLAGLMLLSAIFLVWNTLRMGMFARRSEIEIMGLVGATNWRIRVPFLIEGLAESLVGGVAAIFALFLLKVVVIDTWVRPRFKIFPLIKNSDVLVVVPWILIAAIFVAVVAGTIGIRRFLEA